MAGEAAYLERILETFEASDFGASFDYGSSTGLRCSVGCIDSGGKFVIAGLSPNGAATIVIRKSVLNPTNPVFKTGQIITVKTGFGDSRRLKIDDAGVKDCIFAWELTLKDPNQNI